MKASELNLSLPFSVATKPPATRDGVKLLVIHTGSSLVQHRHFQDLVEEVLPGDLLVVNDSQMIPGRVKACSRGQDFVLHLAGRLSANRFLVERRSRAGEPDWSHFSLDDLITVVDDHDSPISQGTVRQHFHPHSRLWIVESEDDWYRISAEHGRVIHYQYLDAEPPLEEYRTLFGSRPGSVEMPSASRPFTGALMTQLRERGVEVAPITLHTTVSSHEVVGEWEEHPILPEWFQIPRLTARRIAHAKKESHRIIAVGTTVVRALETALDHNGYPIAQSGWTTRILSPDQPPALVDGLITGLHDNFTSHLALLYSFASRDLVRSAYEEAAAHGYLWHEFGDLSLICP